MDKQTVDVVIPVYNEERDLVPSVRRLHAYLDARFPFPTTITIVDNASTDATWPIAEYLATELSNVRAIHLDAKGRGRAPRTAWLGSPRSPAACATARIPFDGPEAPDCRVAIARTAVDDPGGILRLRSATSPWRSHARCSPSRASASRAPSRTRSSTPFFVPSHRP